MIKNLNNFRKSIILPSPQFNEKKSILFLFLFLVITCFSNFQARNIEKNYWANNKDTFYVDDFPITRSGDPGYYLGTAKNIKDNLDYNKFESFRLFPNKIDNKNKTYDHSLISKVIAFIANDTRIKDETNGFPLLAYVISFLSKDSSTKEITKGANLLVLIASILTPLGIFFLFLTIGRPYEGLIACFFLGFSNTFYYRSSYGYIDTDLLNVFFIYLLYGLIYLASKKRDLLKSFILVVLAGCIGKLFYAWYPKRELILLSLLSLIFLTSLNFKKLKDILIINLTYIAITGVSTYISVIEQIMYSPYFGFKTYNSTSFSFAGIFEFIGELQKPSIITILGWEFPLYLGLFSTAGLILWGFSNPKKFLGLAPLTAFILTIPLLGNRAFYYWSPFMFFGGAYLTNFILINVALKYNIPVKQTTIYFLTTTLLITFFAYHNKPFDKRIPNTLITHDTIRAFDVLNKIVKNKNNSVVATPWSYGYQAILYSDLPTLLDGGAPSSPRHYFLARAFLAPSIEETTKTLNYIVSGNVEKLEEKGINTFQKLAKDIYASDKPDIDIYLVLTGQMRGWLHELSHVAYWDIENDKPHFFNEIKASDAFNLSAVICDQLDPKKFTTACYDPIEEEKKMIFDLASGLIDGEPKLKRVVQINDDKVVLNKEFPESSGNLVFQIINRSSETNIYVTHEIVYKSSYNQLFHLNADKDYELIYDQYPFVKVYKVN